MTPAQQAGFVIGKFYLTKENSWQGGGHIVEFTYDDGTECPQFRGATAYSGNSFYERLEKLEPLEAEAKAEPVAVHVSLNGNSTTIVVQRNLTPDEVSAVLKAINQ